ncbi:polysaccharide biosynthesis/export family protein [Roseococcus suduntuyensis]|uniref:Protein involved in polysaccharide export with SLBB domain n=1 Tax=Roseococcus suduntuyensis TaxID=455361 RepID=A0A840AGD6_9PROT|nr:polysaccharide biosynthesis/export family protein [Roseococcus suduntuyensis]MBB3900087.1 protein involved in polysaccharide export with SLBB domain [Roseococcus suduntuyensis]
MRRALLLLPLLAACTGQEIRVQQQRPEGFTAWTDAPPVYRFGPGDRLNVRFRLTPELNEVALVGPDGTIALRAAGRVRVGGLSPAEAEAAIAEASRRLLLNPEVSVAFDETAANQVFVGGMVERSGAFPLVGRRGVLEAIMLAGGFTPEARMNEVVLIRRDPENRPMLRTVNLQGFAARAEADVPLFPGDIVFVPRSRIAEVANFVDQAINRTLPFSRGFSYTINRGATAGTF